MENQGWEGREGAIDRGCSAAVEEFEGVVIGAAWPLRNLWAVVSLS